MTSKLGLTAGAAAALIIATGLSPSGALATTSHNPLLRVDSATSSFSPARTSFVARLRRWTFDRDASSRALTVKVTEAGVLRARVTTTVLRRDVNAAYHITGYHGYDITINAKPGPHRYCVTASNVGAGASTVKCVSMTVTADVLPIGHLDALRVINGLIVATGWAYDANDPSYSTDIKLASSEPPPSPGAAYAGATAGYPSPDVDAAYHITGKHRFNVTLGNLNDGTWTICATAMDLAPTYPFNGLLGCLQVTVHNDPFGQAQATVSSGNVHLDGYAVDPSDTSASLTVRVMLSPPATQYQDFPADLPSDAIDTQLGISGNHAFSIDIPALPGDYSVFLDAINIGPGFDKQILAEEITVPS